MSDIELSETEGDQEFLNSPDTKENRYRFKEADEINLLKEVLLEKPFLKKGNKVWNEIFQKLKIGAKNAVSLKKPFNLLMRHFKASNVKSLRASGTEEEYPEKMRLLQDIADLMETEKLLMEPNQENELRSRKIDDDLKKAQAIRRAATEAFSKECADERTETPKKKRSKSDDFTQYLRENENKEQEAKTRALDLEDRKL